MLKFLKKIIKLSMDPDEENYDMLDVLAYNCSELMEKITNEKNPDEIDATLMEYIARADVEQKSINDFKEDLDWFNVTEPLSTNDLLLGKIVILDFFTYCCINCMHILPDLKKLEQVYKIEDGLVVIGVHSAKFDNEKDSANILSAVQRYNITHPVVNDSTSAMWIDLKIKCWPTLLVLGPRANPLFVLMGEGHYNILEKYIGAAIKFYTNNNFLKSHPLPLNPATELLMSSQMKFPGKIACYPCEEKSQTPTIFAISDSGNHRILITTSIGHIIHKIGGKQMGFIDGDFSVARFNSPQGLTFLNGNVVFVADTENHAIRRVDLTTKMVSTIAGTGVQGNDRIGGKIGCKQEISSPWDVAVYRTRDMDMSFHLDEQNIPEKDIVLVATAGTHQIWAIFLNDVIWWKFKKFSTGTVISIAGNGQEENRNNSYPYNAGFAQPSGLTIDKDNKEAYIADSESSSVRKLSLADGKVLPVAGGDRNPLNLFAFGDVDGKQYSAKLQHPLGLTYNPRDNCVYVADTYNHKIKRIDVTTSVCTSLNLIDVSGNSIQLNEPGGLCVNPAEQLLYIADTNNHSIEVVNLDTMLTESFQLRHKIENNSNAANVEKLGDIFKSTTFKLSQMGGKINLKIQLNVADDVNLAKDAPQKWSTILPNDSWKIIGENCGNVALSEPINFTLIVPKEGEKLSMEEITFYIALRLIVCKLDLCCPKLFSIAFNVIYSDDGESIVNHELTSLILNDKVVL